MNLLLAVMLASLQEAPPAADAKTEKLIPCTVQAHGMTAMITGLAGQRDSRACDNSVDPYKMPVDQLIQIIPDQHPAFYYILAVRLFDAGKKDDAVFWFYAGQLRYRTRLACHPGLPRDTEPALFGSLQNDVGEKINGWAGGDPEAWAMAVERAIAWDIATHNGYEPKAPCKAAIADQHEGARALAAMIREKADEIRRTRTDQGLENR